jgi:large subunit ribosomal protein L13
LTASAKPSEVVQDWYLLDLNKNQKALGRLATEVARVLRGKHKPSFTSHVDTGDYVIVTNTAMAHVTGNKNKKKLYQWHTGYPGGIREVTFEKMLDRNSNRVFRLAVKRMLPKGPLGDSMLKKLKLYSGDEHSHTAQQPKCFAEKFLQD